MIYQARLKGQAGQGNQGFTEVNTEATVLIDTGATQDFVGQRYVQRHDLRTLPARKMTVTLADGQRLVADRMVAVTLSFGKYDYVRHIYVLPLGVSADIILGMPWLNSLGEFTCNMRSHELSFVHKSHGKSERIVLQAQPDSPKLQSSKILRYGQAIHQIRLAKRFQRAKQGPTVEQNKAAAKAARQGRNRPYDHEDDPLGCENDDLEEPWGYLCYLLPSRDDEDEKGGAGPTTTPAQPPSAPPAEKDTAPGPGAHQSNPGGWNLPLPGDGPSWKTLSALT